MFRKLFGSRKTESDVVPVSPIVPPSSVVQDLNQVATVLRASGYRIEHLEKRDLVPGISHERIRVFRGGIRFVISFDQRYFTFGDMYRMNGRFHHVNMAKWNHQSQFASFTYSGGDDLAVLKHSMPCGVFGVTDKAIIYFAQLWEDLMATFRKQNALSLSDQV